MQYKTLSLILLSTAAFAAPQDAAYYSSLEAAMATETNLANLETMISGVPTDYLSGMPTDIPTVSVPPSILSVLETAIPTSDLTQFANPSAEAAFISEVKAGNTPAWYQSLPASVKQWLSSAYQTGAPTAAATTTGAGATPTGSSGSQAATTGSQSSSAAAKSSTSHAGAPAATGAVAFSLAGAAGILGLAIAL